MESSKDGFYRVVLFIIWPLLAVGLAFKNYKNSWAKNVLWAFVAFYGFVFSIGSESQNSDIVRYAGELQRLYSHQMSFGDIVLYFQQSNDLDVVQTFIAVILSNFTDSQSILTLVYGLIFGFFFSRNMWFVLDRLEGKLKPIVIILFVSFFLVIPPWELNGFRFWTATHVFIYGTLLYLFDAKKGGIFIAFLSVLFHFAFIVPVGILLAYMLAGNRLVLYFSFFMLTFFVSTINISAFNKMVENYAPKVLQERTSSYRSETKVEEYRTDVNKDTNWYVVWYNTALRWVLMAFMAILFLKGRKFFLDNYRYLRLFCFALLFFGCANLLSSLPSGGRYVSIASLLSLALILLYIQNREQEVVMKRLAGIAMPGLLLFIIVSFRTGLYSMSVAAILGNPVIALFMQGNFISLNDFIKSIL